MKKQLVLLSALLLFALSYVWVNATFLNTNCYDFGYNAYSYWDEWCYCGPWYHFEKNHRWQLVCVKDQSCTTRYWSNAITDAYWNCSCKNWYMFYNDPNWDKYCIEWNKHCEFLYWNNALYSGVSQSCGCKYWYELSLDIYGAWYICRSCTSKYWTNAYFNDKTWICDCREWYSIRWWKCEKNTFNALYYLAEYTWSNEVLVVSYDDNKAYRLKVQSTNKTYETKDYVWKMVTINLWTNWKLDKRDIFMLENKEWVSGVKLYIENVKEVNFNFNSNSCDKMYWKNSFYLAKQNCVCKEWYRLSEDKTTCEWIPLRQIDYYESSTPTKNSIFDTSDLFKK